jgi:hypothetical protein
VNGTSEEFGGDFEFGGAEGEWLADQESEFGGDFEADFEADYETDFESDYEADFTQGETDFGQGEGPFSEEQELDLAAELLAVSDEAELDQFLGKLIRRAGRAAGRFVRSPTGRALGGILRSAAKKALPVAGRALGTAIGGPAGGAIGGKLATLGGQVFGLELEGMSPEDQELEIARRFVRFAGDAAVRAAQRPGGPPSQVARSAIVAAARRHAPGMLRGAGRPGGARPGSRRLRGGGRPAPGGAVAPPLYTGPASAGGARCGCGTRSGRWIRRGRHIVLLGA